MPRIGLGTGALGHLYTGVSDDQAEATLEHAYDAGIRFFDTAPLYGAGLAERRLGRVLRSKRRGEFIVSTKVGRLVDAEGPTGGWHFDFSYDGVMRSLEASLRRLGLDRVDILHLHDPDTHVEEATDSGARALRQLRHAGTIAAFGVGMNRVATLVRIAETTDIDCLLVANRFTLLDRTAETALLPLCVEKEIAAIAGGVFNSGLLASPAPGATFNYEPAPQDLIERARTLAEICGRHGVPLKAAALQFPFHHPAVNAILIGPRSVAELDENLKLLDLAIPENLWADVDASDALLR
ncbi:MAG TPA: aldo/keto reductase [Candidatus Sulfotelmatobacter sp.]|nr:aldo/keto reductase [Candidatus Sulfotelmatobacter sp.]